MYVVLSGSMSPALIPKFSICRTASIDMIKEGDIITYTTSNSKQPISHRAVAIITLKGIKL